MICVPHFVHIVSVFYHVNLAVATGQWLAGPGKRWRHSMVSGRAYIDPVDGLEKQQIAIFGGHRLWHGFSPENDQTNNWGSYETRPIGGYLDDLWVYTKYLDFSFPGQTFKTNNGKQLDCATQ